MDRSTNYSIAWQIIAPLSKQIWKAGPTIWPRRVSLRDMSVAQEDWGIMGKMLIGSLKGASLVWNSPLLEPSKTHIY